MICSIFQTNIFANFTPVRSCSRTKTLLNAVKVLQYGDYSIFLPGLVHMYLSNQYWLSLVLLVLLYLIFTAEQTYRYHYSLILLFHEQLLLYKVRDTNVFTFQLFLERIFTWSETSPNAFNVGSVAEKSRAKSKVFRLIDYLCPLLELGVVRKSL